MSRTISAVTLGILALTIGASAQQNKKDTSSPDVTGKWVVSAQTPHGAQPLALTLEQSGKDVTGTFASPHGDLHVTGGFAEGTLTLDTDSPHMTFKAKVKADGTLTGYISSEMGDTPFTAERAKAR